MKNKNNNKITQKNFHSALLAASVILLIINISLYWKSRNFDFVWDDQRTHIHANRNLMEDNVGEFWKKPYTGLYIPVSYTTWNRVKNISLKDVNGNKIPDSKTFHTVSIFLHAINVILLFYLFYLLIGNLIPAFLAALIFSLHPLQVETVAWISEYRGLLSMFFTLCSLICYYFFRKKRNLKFALYASLLFVLALLSKPSAVVLPFIIAAFDFFIFKPEEKKWFFPALWLLLALPVMIITKLSQPDAEVEFVAPLWSRVFIVGDTISFYLYKLFWPFGLSVSYGRTPEAVLESRFFYFLWIIPAGLLYLIWKIKDNLPFVSLGILIFLVSILPVSGILSFEFQKFSTVADRYMYLPMIGVTLVLASLINKFKNKYSYLFSGIVAFVFLIINVDQQEIWKDDLTLWRTTAEQNPGQPHVHNNYGISLHDVGRFDEAIQQYNLALQVRPEFASAYNNRGNSYAFKRDFQQARADQTRAIEIDPGFGRAWFNRAVTHFQLGRLQQAMHDLEQAERNGYRAHPQFRRDLEKEMQRRK